MKYLIYIAVAALILWAVVYLVRHIRRQMKGDCGSCGHLRRRLLRLRLRL